MKWKSTIVNDLRRATKPFIGPLDALYAWIAERPIRIVTITATIMLINALGFAAHLYNLNEASATSSTLDAVINFVLLLLCFSGFVVPLSLFVRWRIDYYFYKRSPYGKNSP